MLRKFILGTASVLVLGIGGAALDFSADADDVSNSSENTLSLPETSHHWINAANLSKDDIRWVQTELHFAGLYNGSLDGVIGPETKQALAEFQKSNGLERTARLDQQTADTLIGDTGGIGQGSSLPPRGAGAGSTTSSAGTSDFGSHSGRKKITIVPVPTGFGQMIGGTRQM